MELELSVIIPAYNEATRLPVTLAPLYQHLVDNRYGDYEVVVANDGSSDDTAAVVERLRLQYPKLRLLDYKQNRGRGAVCQNAVREVEGKYILITDADGSTNPQAIVPFIQYLDTHPEVDVLTGSRDIQGATIVTPQSPLRVFLNKVFLLMAKVLFGWPMHDRVNGFKLFRREAAMDVYPHQTETSFFAEAELIYIADIRGWRVVELPIVWSDDSESRVRPLREAWRSFWGMFKIVSRGRNGEYNADHAVINRHSGL